MLDTHTWSRMLGVGVCKVSPSVLGPGMFNVWNMQAAWQYPHTKYFFSTFNACHHSVDISQVAQKFYKQATIILVLNYSYLTRLSFPSFWHLFLLVQLEKTKFLKICGASVFTSFFPSVSVSVAFLKASSNGFLFKSLNKPISSQLRRNLVGVGVWSEKIMRHSKVHSLNSWYSPALFTVKCKNAHGFSSSSSVPYNGVV